MDSAVRTAAIGKGDGYHRVIGRTHPAVSAGEGNAQTELGTDPDLSAKCNRGVRSHGHGRQTPAAFDITNSGQPLQYSHPRLPDSLEIPAGATQRSAGSVEGSDWYSAITLRVVACIPDVSMRRDSRATPLRDQR